MPLRRPRLNKGTTQAFYLGLIETLVKSVWKQKLIMLFWGKIQATRPIPSVSVHNVRVVLVINHPD